VQSALRDRQDCQNYELLQQHHRINQIILLSPIHKWFLKRSFRESLWLSSRAIEYRHTTQKNLVFKGCTKRSCSPLLQRLLYFASDFADRLYPTPYKLGDFSAGGEHVLQHHDDTIVGQHVYLFTFYYDWKLWLKQKLNWCSKKVCPFCNSNYIIKRSSYHEHTYRWFRNSQLNKQSFCINITKKTIFKQRCYINITSDKRKYIHLFYSKIKIKRRRR